MSLMDRFGHWLRASVLRETAAAPVITDELKTLADRVEVIEEHANQQDRRLTRAEIQIGIRSPERWPKRDAG